MKFINLYGGERAVVDDEDYERVNYHRWYISKNTRGHAYATATIDGRWVGMHRFILNATSGMFVDHANRNGLDNRRSNLRLCTSAQNRANSIHKRKFPKGVYLRVNRSGSTVYRAQIRSNGRLTNLGTYTTIEEAASAYANAARVHHGEFARF